MILPSSVLFSFLVALFRGGKASALRGLRFNGIYFLAGAIVLRLLLILPPLQPALVSPALGELRVGGLVYIFSLLLALAMLLTNIRLPGIVIMTCGMLSNFLVITANLGQMPGAPDQLNAAGYSGPPPGRWSHVMVMGPETPLSFLGDILLIGRPWPHPFVISIGDAIIALGAFWFFQRIMAPARK